MKLSRHNAEAIVKDINSIIHQKINMMDENGMIIASSDYGRIGTFHEGAKQIIDHNLDELIVSASDEYRGTHEGVNYPIVVQGEIVGVVGITGPLEEVSNYGQIIRKLVEILMKDITIQEQKSMEESARNRYLSEWLQNGNVAVNRSFVERGLSMEMDITIPRRILAIAVHTEPNQSNTLENMRSIEQMEARIRSFVTRLHPDNIILKTVYGLACVVTNRSDQEMHALAEQIREKLSGIQDICLSMGIDDGCHNYTMAYMSYTNAYKALQASMKNQKYDIQLYNDIHMEIFMDEIPEASKNEYVKKLFLGYSHEELQETIALLTIFYEKEGSIGRVSEELHMHKNTLQYKLRKIYDRTGYDPRSIQNASLFQMAIYFFRDASLRIPEK